MMYHGGPLLNRVIASKSSSCDMDEHFEMVPSVLLAQENEISSGTGTPTEVEKKGTEEEPFR